MKSILHIIGLCTFLSLSIQAQKYEIRSNLIDNNSLVIEMRALGQSSPQQSDFITDLVFGLKWNNSLGIDLSNVIYSEYQIQKSGIQTLQNGLEFQAFYASATPFAVPENWTSGEWIEIARIALSSAVPQALKVQIAESSFSQTTELNIGVNLTDHDIVINGYASTINDYYFDFSVNPNISNSQAVLISRVNVEAAVSFYVYTLDGKRIYSDAFERGQSTVSIDDLTAGVYIIKMGDQAKKLFIH